MRRGGRRTPVRVRFACSSSRLRCRATGRSSPAPAALEGSARRGVLRTAARAPARRHRSVELQETRRSAGHRRGVPRAAAVAQVRHRAFRRSRTIRSRSIPIAAAGCSPTARSMRSNCSKRWPMPRSGPWLIYGSACEGARDGGSPHGLSRRRLRHGDPPRCPRVWRPMWGRCGKSAIRTPRTWRRRFTRRCSSGVPVSAKRWRLRAAACARGNRISTSSLRDRISGARRGPEHAPERGVGRDGAVRRPDADGAAAPQPVRHKRFGPAQRPAEASRRSRRRRPTPSPGAREDATSL